MFVDQSSSGWRWTEESFDGKIDGILLCSRCLGQENWLLGTQASNFVVFVTSLDLRVDCWYFVQYDEVYMLRWVIYAIEGFDENWWDYQSFDEIDW